MRASIAGLNMSKYQVCAGMQDRVDKILTFKSEGQPYDDPVSLGCQSDR